MWILNSIPYIITMWYFCARHFNQKTVNVWHRKKKGEVLRKLYVTETVYNYEI